MSPIAALGDKDLREKQEAWDSEALQKGGCELYGTQVPDLLQMKGWILPSFILFQRKRHVLFHLVLILFYSPRLGALWGTECT